MLRTGHGGAVTLLSMTRAGNRRALGRRRAEAAALRVGEAGLRRLYRDRCQHDCATSASPAPGARRRAGFACS